MPLLMPPSGPTGSVVTLHGLTGSAVNAVLAAYSKVVLANPATFIFEGHLDFQNLH